MSARRPKEEAKLKPRVGGRYELLLELASGGMATVHIARSRGIAGFGRLVAIKCCHPHMRSDEDFARMFLDEARLVAELRHPNVVATLDFGEDDALSLYIVMEYVDGFSVQQLLRMAKNRGLKMPAPVALRIVIDTLQGLQAAHDHTDSKGKPLHIVHRDVSPQNILLGVDGVARIMDFGIARAESRLSHTRDGNIKGKAAYMAPEQHGLLMDDPPPLTHRADLYAMGVVLWELLAGKRLFQRENDAQTLAAAIRGDYVPATEFDPSLPAKLDVVVATALKSDPSARYASATAFIEAIESCGLAAASPRDVTKWVRDVAGEQIETRHSALRKLADEGADDEADALIDRVLTSATNAKMQAEIESTGVVPAYAAGDVVELEVQSLVPNEPKARRSSEPPATPARKWRAYAALAVVAILVGTAFAFSRSAPASRSIAGEQTQSQTTPGASDSSARSGASNNAGSSAVDSGVAEPSSNATNGILANDPATSAARNADAGSVTDPTRRPASDGLRQRTPRTRNNSFRPTFL
ncbi:MAG: serine/threonine-protein kinase [Polyangiales bacterium]